MKPALTTTTTILGCILAAGLASAQSPSIIQNTRNTMNTVSNNATAASNEALSVHQSTPAPASASATHAPAKLSGVAVVKPAKSSSTHAGASSASAKKTGPKSPRFAPDLFGAASGSAGGGPGGAMAAQMGAYGKGLLSSFFERNGEASAGLSANRLPIFVAHY